MTNSMTSSAEQVAIWGTYTHMAPSMRFGPIIITKDKLADWMVRTGSVVSMAVNWPVIEHQELAAQLQAQAATRQAG